MKIAYKIARVVSGRSLYNMMMVVGVLARSVDASMYMGKLSEVIC